MDATRSKSLTGLSKAWLTLRMDNRFYICNKVLSVILASAFAATTLSFKPDVQAYSKSVVGSDAADTAESYKFIYWFLFIFYSF